MKTEIIAESGKQELFIHRVFDAPRELVYKAFSDPDILLKFFAPKGILMKFDHHDYRTGGSYRYTHYDAEGVVLCIFNGVIHEMASPERIVLTSELEDQSILGRVVLEIYEFTELNGNRTKLTIQTVCRSVEDRDLMANSGMDSGVISIFNNLDELLLTEYESK
ncbi:SRPBCC domain-containing protein [Reichenbachiella sp. MALMAid0571]|uniref:SRPBCC domain-containing protein n=1 Tax=Reichenbachiella sp. MALMAid0571 TaxID=3143939 RepID=UPI0032DFBD45